MAVERNLTGWSGKSQPDSACNGRNIKQHTAIRGCYDGRRTGDEDVCYALKGAKARACGEQKRSRVAGDRCGSVRRSDSVSLSFARVLAVMRAGVRGTEVSMLDEAAVDGMG
jgi:hypothetical protein